MLIFEQAINTAREQSTLEGKDSVGSFFEVAKGAALFVFEKTQTTKENEPSDLKERRGLVDLEDVDSTPELLDLPFPTVFFEQLSDDSIIESESTEDGEADYAIIGVLVREKAPRDYEMFLFGRAAIDGKYYDQIIPTDSTSTHYAQYRYMVHDYLSRLHKSVIATESIPVRKIKLGTGAGKEHRKIKDIIRVAPPSKRFQLQPAFGGSIDWTHRWSVRGHWRRTKYIGKDRDGHYRIKGFTWVSHHEKGPENKPLIHKTRLILNHEKVPTNTQPPPIVHREISCVSNV